MDIPLPAKTQSLLALHPGKNTGLLQLKIGQKISATITQTAPDKQTLQIKIAGTIFSAHTSPSGHNITAPAPQQTLNPGQVLKLLVTRLLPTPELTVQNPSRGELSSSTTAMQQHPAPLVLKLNPLPVSTPARPAKQAPTLLLPGQQITASVLQSSDRQLQLQLISPQVSPANEHNTEQKSLFPQRLITITNVEDFIGKTPGINKAPLFVGQTLHIEVIKPGPVPTFKLLKTREPFTPVEKLISATVKQLLPRQQPASELLKQLITVLSVQSSHKNLPETVLKLARQLLQALPQAGELTQSRTLQKAVSDSGVLLEAKLSQALTESKDKPELQLKTDFKANLFKFIHLLKQATVALPEQNSASTERSLSTDLLSRTENSIARLILDQLTSLPRDDAAKQVWNFELPFMDKQKPDAVRIRIEQDRRHNAAQKNNNWSVTITLKPPKLDTIYCKIAYFDQTVNTYFWSNQSATTRLIQQNLDYLRECIEEKGLKTGHLAAQCGTPEDQTFKQSTATQPSCLLDEKI